MIKRILGVCVFAFLPLFSFGQDERPVNAGYSYNVEADPESASANVLQLLEKLPNVMVTATDEISIAGCSGIVLYVDGIQQTLMYPGSYLKSLPANRVRSIEIRTLPRVSDQLPGDNGIISITTKKQESNGISATVTAQGSTASTVGSGLLLNMKHKKFFLDGGYSFRYQDEYGTTWSDVHTPTIEQWDRHIKTHNTSLHTGLELTEKDVVGVVFTSIMSNWDGIFDIYTPPYRQNQPAYNIAAYYKHNFSKGATLKLTYSNGQSKNEIHNDFENRLRSNDWRIDVSIPTSKTGQVEFGGNYYTKETDYHSRYNDMSEWDNEYKRWSIYGQYVWKLPTLQFHAGLLGSDYTLNDESDEPFRLSPYLGMGWDIDEHNQLDFQYTYQQTNFADHIYQKKIHKAEINYRHTRSKWNFMADLNYKYSGECSAYVLFENPEPRYDWFGDAGLQQLFLSLSARYALSKRVSLYGSGMLAFQHLTPRPQEPSDMIYGKLTAGSDIFLPSDFCLAINGGYYFPEDDGRDIQMPNYFYRLNLSKEFGNKRWKASLYATDFFGKKKLESTFRDYFTPRVTSERTFPTNEFGISLSYRFL